MFDAIVKKEVLDVTYHHFGKKPRVRQVHPYQLRQSGNRWYLVGYEERLAERHKLVMLPIDRIDEVQKVQVVREVQGVEEEFLRMEGPKFIEKPADLDIDDYFYDIVGVSLNPESEPEKIVLKVGYPDAEYLNSKPIHGSQHLVGDSSFRVQGVSGVQELPCKVFELKLIPNEEFMQQLLTYAHNAEVVKPQSLRKAVFERAEAIKSHNQP